MHCEALRGGWRVAFVFGSERFGMSNEDVYRCHACLSIPTDPSYGSLNLAQAVQLIAYEWRMALGGVTVAGTHAEGRGADTRRCRVPSSIGLACWCSWGSWTLWRRRS